MRAAFLFLLLLSFSPLKATSYYIATAENLDSIIQDIYQQYSVGIFISPNVVRDFIDERLRQKTNIDPELPSLNGVRATGEIGQSALLRWTPIEDINKLVFGAQLDLQSSDTFQFNSSSSGVIMDSQRVFFQLYALHRESRTGQSLVNIIVIDKDLGKMATPTPISTPPAPRAFPNPSSQHLTLEFPIPQSTEVTITLHHLSTGQQVATLLPTQALFKGHFRRTFSLPTLPNGPYLIQIIGPFKAQYLPLQISKL